MKSIDNSSLGELYLTVFGAFSRSVYSSGPGVSYIRIFQVLQSVYSSGPGMFYIRMFQVLPGKGV